MNLLIDTKSGTVHNKNVRDVQMQISELEAILAEAKARGLNEVNFSYMFEGATELEDGFEADGGDVIMFFA